MNLEQVKEHFKYAKEVRCLADGKICDITKASNQGFYKNILDNIQVDGSVGDYNCLLYRENTNQLAEILTYIFDRGEEVIVWDEDGKEYINLPIDWVKTKEKGKYVYNFNYDTEGYFFGWLWFKKTARFKNVDLWFFKPSRLTSRLLTHYLRTDEKYQHIYQCWKI